jgi:hypothetical protein
MYKSSIAPFCQKPASSYYILLKCQQQYAKRTSRYTQYNMPNERAAIHNTVNAFMMSHSQNKISP